MAEGENTHKYVNKYSKRIKNEAWKEHYCDDLYLFIYVCVCVCHMCIGACRGQRRGLELLGQAVTGSSEPPRAVWRTKPQSQQVFLTTEEFAQTEIALL